MKPCDEHQWFAAIESVVLADERTSALAITAEVQCWHCGITMPGTRRSQVQYVEGAEVTVHTEVQWKHSPA